MKFSHSALCLVLVFCAVLALALTFPGAAAAAEPTVWLDGASGSDAGSGERTSPKKTLNAAIAALGGADGEIRLLSDCTITGEFSEEAHAGRVTLSSEGGAALALSAASVYRMNGETVFGDLEIRAGSKAVIAAQFNPVTFGEGVRISAARRTSLSTAAMKSRPAPIPRTATPASRSTAETSSPFAASPGPRARRAPTIPGPPTSP